MLIDLRFVANSLCIALFHGPQSDIFLGTTAQLSPVGWVEDDMQMWIGTDVLSYQLLTQLEVPDRTANILLPQTLDYKAHQNCLCVPLTLFCIKGINHVLTVAFTIGGKIKTLPGGTV